ncbi:MAG: threonine synthase, partial [Rhizobiaceae bacterium]
AHPAKFPDAVRQACGVVPHLPDWLDGLMTREERYVTLPSDQQIVEEYVRRHARAAA